MIVVNVLVQLVLIFFKDVVNVFIYDFFNLFLKENVEYQGKFQDQEYKDGYYFYNGLSYFYIYCNVGVK